VESEDILDEEVVCIVAGKHHVLRDIPHTFLLKEEVLCPHQRGID
jgi:hypothetical protein